MRQIKWLILGLSLSFIAGLITLFISFQHFIYTPMVQDKPQVLELKPGNGLFSLQQILQQRGLLSHTHYFAWLANYTGQDKCLRAGEYWLPIGITPSALLSLLCSGKVIQHELTLIEGWNYRQVLQALAKNPMLQHSLESMTQSQIKAKLGIAEPSIEGLFFPDTYRFPKNTSDLLFLQRAYKLMQHLLAKEWQQRQVGLPYKSPYQALIAASIVEREAKLAEERPLIAGVIVKRLQMGMRLQMDSPLIYGLGESYTGKIYKSELRIDTPYNTYLNAGLPPTPIAIPSQASLHAALHPIVTQNIFFMARGDGGHFFSATLAEHDKALQVYLSHQPKAHE